jgi:hypothetical protein
MGGIVKLVGEGRGGVGGGKEAGALFLLLLAPLVLLPHLKLKEYELFESCGFGIRMGKNPGTDPR